MTTPTNLHPFPTRPGAKVGIAIDLDHLEVLAKEYIVAMGGDGNNDIAERLTLSLFIAYLRQKRASHGAEGQNSY